MFADTIYGYIEAYADQYRPCQRPDNVTRPYDDTGRQLQPKTDELSRTHEG